MIKLRKEKSFSRKNQKEYLRYEKEDQIFDHFAYRRSRAFRRDEHGCLVQKGSAEKRARLLV